MKMPAGCGWTAALISSTLLFASVPAAEPETPLGLYVRDGVLLQDGAPYRAIGANYFSLFSRRLQDPDDLSYREGLEQLSAAGIPFVRFMACGFWPVDWDLYRRDPETYFALLDEVVAAAEATGMGLIPSLFWYYPAVPDLVGESMDQLGNPRSASCAWIRRYTEEVVTRYRHSPAVWGWEMGNEYNLAVDLPNAASHRPPVWPRLGTAPQRTERDELTSEQMLVAFGEFARTVRRHDPHRILVTGNSIPRPSAYHNTAHRTWQRDTLEQFTQVLRRDNPDPFDTLSVHIYPEDDGQYPARAESVQELVAIVQDLAVEAGKPLLIGEFGPGRSGDPARDRTEFEAMVQAVEESGAALAAFWVFDLPAQEATWNVTFENDRAFMIEVAAQANARLRRARRDGASAAERGGVE